MLAKKNAIDISFSKGYTAIGKNGQVLNSFYKTSKKLTLKNTVNKTVILILNEVDAEIKTGIKISVLVLNQVNTENKYFCSKNCTYSLHILFACMVVVVQLLSCV